eukprot:2378288-Rhodomonas_salina.1
MTAPALVMPSGTKQILCSTSATACVSAVAKGRFDAPTMFLVRICVIISVVMRPAREKKTTSQRGG